MSFATRTTTSPVRRRAIGPRYQDAGAGRQKAVQGHVLIVQHDEMQPAGLLTELLAARALEPRTVRTYEGERLPAAPWDTALIVALGRDREPAGGGEHGVEDPGEQEVAWLHAADRAGIPILALGAGAEALATALGGGVERARHPHHGWVTVTTHDPDTLSEGPWLAWHDAVLRLPSGAEALAEHDGGPVAFRTGDHLAIRLHPEVTPGIVRSWIGERPAPILDVQGLLEATARTAPAAAAASYRLFGGYLSDVVGPQAAVL